MTVMRTQRAESERTLIERLHSFICILFQYTEGGRCRTSQKSTHSVDIAAMFLGRDARPISYKLWKSSCEHASSPSCIVAHRSIPDTRPELSRRGEKLCVLPFAPRPSTFAGAQKERGSLRGLFKAQPDRYKLGDYKLCFGVPDRFLIHANLVTLLPTDARTRDYTPWKN